MIRRLLFSLIILTIADTSLAKADCFPYDIASIMGFMNIREDSTTNSDIVGTARAGDALPVLHSKNGKSWCWVQTRAGWIAHTARVTGINREDLYPSIEGSDTKLMRHVREALDWMREETPFWFDYVAAVIGVIIVEKPNNVWSLWSSPGGARARVNYDQTFIWGFEGERTIPLYLSSVLIHEACHHYQWDEGRFYGRSRIMIERECQNMQMRIVRIYAPNHPIRRTLERDIGNALIRES